MDGLFDVIFEGRLIPGRDPVVVKAALAELFNAPAETIDRLFSGTAVPIKKNIDHATAVRYISALKEAGALARLKPVETVAPVEPAVAATPVPITAAAPAARTSSFTVAPVGADLTEAKAAVARVVDTSAYSVAAVGATLAEARTVTPVEVGDLSGYSMAAVGTILTETRETIPLPEPDISGLSVAAVGATLSEAKAVVSVPIADLDLTLAPVGSALDTSEKKPAPPAPPTDHLKLS